ncbi:MAG: hypothetical protein IPL32_02830 [Chloracidobacterium sp.]|nr:hypothetical protein [Chloracidobacterium sp.]
MKNFFKIFLCITVMVSMQTVAFGQTFGYMVSDNDQDATNFPQALFRVNLASGETKYLGDLLVDRNNDGVWNESIAAGTGERVQREYEGLASIGGVLYGVPEFATLSGQISICNTGSDPISGLSTDLRTFRYNGPQQTVPSPGNRLPAPVGVGAPGTSFTTSGIVGPQIGETCIAFGSESALGYNAVDGFLYSIASDDLIALPAIRSRVYKIDPTTGLAVASADVTNPMRAVGSSPSVPSVGDINPYMDGFTILPSGFAYGSELRFDVDAGAADPDTRDAGALYRVYLGSGTASGGDQCTVGTPVSFGSACLVKHLLPGVLSRDTGLGNQANGTMYILNERGLLYRTTLSPTSTVTTITLQTTGATSGAGGGAAGTRIEGCRGAVLADEFQATTLTTGGCRDLESFDIPLVTLNQPSI